MNNLYDRGIVWATRRNGTKVSALPSCPPGSRMVCERGQACVREQNGPKGKCEGKTEERAEKQGKEREAGWWSRIERQP